jgi:TFIIF, beta subunit HTH domain/TFIIF, beta subunit N-terminus
MEEESIIEDSIPLPVQTSRYFPVDVDKFHRKVWIVRLPDVVADAIKSTNETNVPIASFKMKDSRLLPSSSNNGKKRQRVDLSCELNSTLLASQDGFDKIPTKYNLSLEEGQSMRLLSFTKESGFTFDGVSAFSGSLVPDMKNEGYIRYSKQKRENEREKLKNKKSTVLGAAPSTGLLQESLQQMPMSSSGETRDRFAGVNFEEFTKVKEPFLIPAIVQYASSIFELFERKAYWTLKDMAQLTRKKENEIKPQVLQSCEYIRSGPHKGTYKLRPEFRSTQSILPE